MKAIEITSLVRILCVAALLQTGCGQKHDAPSEQALAAASVRVRKLEERARAATEEVVGTVRAKLRASVESKISGRIQDMLVAAGQAVTNGQLLALLDVREIKARLDQATAASEQAERELKRFATLLEQKTVTRQEYDAVEARDRIAKAAVTEAATMLEYARMTAPFDGLITRKLADVGDLASPGRPLLEIEDPKLLRLEADVPEALLGRVQLGAKMSVRVAASTNQFEGVVSEISPAVDPGSRTFRVKLDLAPSPELRVGQFGRVLVPVGESVALRAPVAAVLQRGQMELAFVVTNGRAQLRIVKTGKRIGDEVELISGVSAGEILVADGAAQLQDGQPVEIKP